MPDEGTEAGDSFDKAGAIAALEAGFAGEVAPDPVATEAEQATEGQQEAQTSDLGELPDLSDLDPAAQAVVRARISEYQRGWTDKTTKLSDANRILQAAGGDPEAVLEAYNFRQTLVEDSPEGEAARVGLYQALQAQYAQQQGAPQEQEAAEEDPFADYDLPPEIRERLNLVTNLNDRLARFEAGMEENAQRQAHQEYLNEIVADLDGKYQELVSEFPDLAGETPEEADAIEEEIMAFGAFTGGNLVEAVDLYRRIEARTLARLTNGAVSVPGGAVSPPAGGGHSTEPVVIENFKQAGEASKEFLERAFAELEG